MNENSVKMTSKKIENKITLVTSILGMIIINIIWIAGFKVSNESVEPSFTQNKSKEETPEVEIHKMPLTVSLQKASLY